MKPVRSLVTCQKCAGIVELHEFLDDKPICCNCLEMLRSKGQNKNPPPPPDIGGLVRLGIFDWPWSRRGV